MTKIKKNFIILKFKILFFFAVKIGSVIFANYIENSIKLVLVQLRSYLLYTKLHHTYLLSVT